MEEQIISNILESCRLCLKQDENIPIFNEVDETVSVSQKIYECVAIKVTKSQDLPQTICKQCLESVNNWYIFKEKCQKTESTLINSNSKNESAEQVDTSKEKDENDENCEDAFAATNAEEDSNIEEIVSNILSLNRAQRVQEADQSNVKLEHYEMETEQIECKKNGLDDNINQEADQIIEKHGHKMETDQIECTKNGLDVEISKMKVEQLKADSSNNDSVKSPNVVSTSDDSNEKKCAEFKVESSENDTHDKDLDNSVHSPQSTSNDPDCITIESDEEYDDIEKENDIDDAFAPRHIIDNGPGSLAPDSTVEPSDDGMAEDDCDIEEIDEIDMDDIDAEHDIEEIEEKKPNSVDVPEVVIKQELEDPGYSGNIANIKVKPEPDVDENQTEVDKPLTSPKVEDLENDPTLDLKHFRCLICKYKYANLGNLMKHTSTKLHLDIKDKSNNGLNTDILRRLLARDRNHMSRKRRGPPMLKRAKKHTCKVCSITYNSLHSLERHETSIKHQNLLRQMNQAKMREVDANYIDVGDTKAPLEEKPEDPRAFMCPMGYCSFASKDGKKLLVHMKTHGIGDTHQKRQKLQNVAPKSPQVQPPQPQQPLPPPKIYRCEHHKLTFANGKGYANHLRICNYPQPVQIGVNVAADSEKANWSCGICCLKFTSKDVYLNHNRVYHAPRAPQFLAKPMVKSSRNYSCNICGKRFNFPVALNYHMRTHQPQQMQPVSLQQLRVVPQLRQQPKPQLQSDPNEITMSCKYCKQSFINAKKMKAHVRAHFLPLGSHKMFCSTCSKIFENRSEMGIHRTSGACRPAKNKNIQCPSCPVVVPNKEILEFHKNTEHFNSAEQALKTASDPFCKLCQKQLSNYSNLRRHCTQVHRMTEESFRNIYNLPGPENSAYEEIDDDIDESYEISFSEPSTSKGSIDGNFVCHLCDKSFTLKRSLTLHLSRFCTVANASKGIEVKPEESFPCNECDKVFQSQRALSLHVNNFCPKTGARLRCKDCGSFVTDKGCQSCSLKSDDTEGRQLFSCPIGKMTFSSETTMNRHYKNCYGNCEQVFNCGDCRKNYDSVTQLEEHECIISTRNSSYRYECVSCSRSFSRKSYLLKHEESCASKKEPTDTPQTVDIPPDGDCYKCTFCPKVFLTLKAFNGHIGWHTKPKTSTGQSQDCKFCQRDNIAFTSLYTHNYKCIKSMLMKCEVISCDECEIIFSREDSGKELATKIQNHLIKCYPIPFHKSEVNPTSEKLLCCYCCYAFSSVEALTRHKSEHLKLKRQRTGYENPRRVKKKAKLDIGPFGGHFLDQFMEVEEVDDQAMIKPLQQSTPKPVYKCNMCSRKFFSVHKLENHEKVHGIVRLSLMSEGSSDLGNSSMSSI